MKTEKFDIQDYLRTPEQRAAYLEAVLEDGDPALIAAARDDIARSLGDARVIRDGETKSA